VPVEHALDPDAVDVLRAHDDHVRGAVEDRQVAVAVDLGEVARAEPAVGRDGLGRRLDVVAAAGEERRAADPDLADALARRGAEAVLLDAVHDADAGGRAAAAPIEARPAVVVRELARLDGPQGADAVAVTRDGSNVSTMEKRARSTPSASLRASAASAKTRCARRAATCCGERFKLFPELFTSPAL
jgi:hypothetical protein